MTTQVQMKDWHELLSAVEGNNGVQRVAMGTLRQLEGRQRAGKHILASIEDKLQTLGLGHLPAQLPNRQQESVLLIRFGTPASEVVEAVRRGLTEGPSEAAGEYLRRLNEIPDPASVVPKAEMTEAINKTAKSVLALLSQVHPNGDTADDLEYASEAKVDLSDIVKGIGPIGVTKSENSYG
jgi:hypothetical protein